MAAPRETRTEASRLGILITGLSDGQQGMTDFIIGQEAEGQREMIASSTIPRKILYATETDLLDLGFTLGEPVDDLFREATLPEGWSKHGTDHDMWSVIVDESGRERCAIFYKAAFYDRRAHLMLSRDETDG